MQASDSRHAYPASCYGFVNFELREVLLAFADGMIYPFKGSANGFTSAMTFLAKENDSICLVFVERLRVNLSI